MQDAEKKPDNSDSPVKKVVSLLRSSVLVSIMTMLSRVLGLVRDICIAALAGATANADAFFIAFKVPQFLRRLFAEGAFSQAFVPVLTEYQEKRSFDEVKLLVDKVAGLLGSSLVFVTVLAVIGAPVVAALFAPGFLNDDHKYQLTADLIRITFPYLFFISMAGFFGAILNTWNRFAIPAITPIILNISLISAALWGVSWFSEPVYALAWGVFVAGICQMLFQLPFLAQLRLVPLPKLDTKDEGVRRILVLMVPALFGVSVSQINLLLDTVLASFLPTGSVSWLYYSDRLVELPLGVFAVAIGTVILPSLSSKHVANKPSHFSDTMDWAIRFVLLISMPAAVALFILAQPILITLFNYGALTANDVKMASYSLQAYTLGLVPFMLIKVLAPGYFSRQDTKTPVKIGIIAMFSNMILNIALVIPLHMYFQLGHVGLALATVLSACLNAGLLLKGLLKEKAFVFRPGFRVILFKYILAIALMVVCLLVLLEPSSLWLQWHWQERVLQLTRLIVSGLFLYLACLWVLGVRPSHFRGMA